MMETLGAGSSIAVGDLLDGKYQITSVLGEGAMGTVYLALHTRLSRTVAVKTLKAELAQEAELVARFEREARAASAIGHPNIVQVYDAGGETGGTPYLVMEALEGRSLGELLHKEGPLPIPRAIELCRQVLAGLAAAHSAGIIHRDLKPDNIFVTRDNQGRELVKILDFGISKVLDLADPALSVGGAATQAGMVMGTPLYMSPEQASGRRDLDHRSDLWALICVLYECLTGAPPFGGENYNQILVEVLQGRFVGLKERRPEVSRALHELVRRGLTLDRDKRFADARSLDQALAAVELGEGAVSGTGARSEDAEMLAAFDNLADRFRQQEAADSVDMDRSTSRSAPTEPGTPPPADDRFAPPEPTEALSLDLEVERSQIRRRTQPGLAARESDRPRRKRRASAEHVTRRDSGRLLGTLAKLLLLILLLAGGGLGYRYYTLGYLSAPEPVPLAKVELLVEPSTARLFLDGELASDHGLSLVGGESFRIRLEAEDRLSMTGLLEPAPGEELRVQVRMAPMIPLLAEATVAATPIPEGGPSSARSLDAAMAKLDRYGDCGARLVRAIAEDAEGAPGEVRPLSSALVEECSLALKTAAESEPAMAELDRASLAWVDGIRTLGQSLHELEQSEGASKKLLRARKRAVQTASKHLLSQVHRWRASMSAAQSRWLYDELALAREREGDSMHVRARELAVLSDSWLRMRVSGQEGKAMRERLSTSYQRVTRAAEAQPELFRRSGARAFLRAVQPLVEGEPGEELLFWHNQAIDLFNQIALPLPSSSSVTPSGNGPK